MKRKLALSLAMLAGTCAAVSTANGQLVVGNDQTTPTIWLLDVSGAVAPRALATGTGTTVWAIAADENNDMLYWTNGSRLFKAAYDLTNPLVVIDVGATTGAACTGLAYDSVTNQLIGRASGGFYEINVNTGAATLLFAITAQDFGGLDYDAATDAFYGTNDSTSTTVIPGARGLYRIGKPISSPTFTELAEYPARLDTGALDTDIDGLAAGGGKLYLVNDVPVQGAYVWNLGTNAFESPIATLPYTGTNGIFSGGAWAPGLFIPPTGADVSVSKVSNPTTLVVPPGGNVTYVVTVQNNGPDMATGVSLSDTLPAGMTFVSVDGGATHNNGVVSAVIGDMAMGEQRQFNIVVSTNVLGTYVNTASVTSTSQDNNSGNNSAQATTLVREPRADISVVVTDPSDCAIGEGGTVSYLITLTNNGPESADNTQLVVNLPAGTTFLSSNPPLVPQGNTLTLDLGTVNSGGGGALTVDVRADVAGQLSLTATGQSSTADAVPGNNSETELTQIIGGAPGSAEAVGIFSTVSTSTSSEVPGLSGARFATGISPGRPFRSPNGQNWIQAWDTDLATSQDQVLLVSENGVVRVAVQEGVTQIPTLQGTDPTGAPYFPLGSFDAIHGINDAGQFVFGGVDSRAGTADDGYVVTGNSGGTFTLVAQENVTEAPPGTGTFFGASRGNEQIASDGTAGFLHSIAGLPTANDEFVLRGSGATVVTQEQITSVLSLDGSLSVTINDISNGSAQLGFFFNADHTAYCANGTLLGQTTTTDAAVIVSGQVRLQEGNLVPGSDFTSLLSSIFANRMEADGTWFVRGDNADNQDWVVKNGAVIARTDAPIFTGSAELFDDAPFANCFFMMLSNNAGDTVIGGTTNAVDDRANAVLVLNNERVLLRENDPVDLDGNGMFDDDFYIRTFIDDRAFMTDTDLYVVVRLRNGLAAQCGGTDSDLGQALIRVSLGNGQPPCDPDFNQDGNVDQDDIACISQVVAGDPSCSPVDPDFNRDGNVDQDDIASL
ncbi:MAG: DUF11 domain-containing protein, partial [Planctomycetota bacterium]|nr:DUF11 domain-containing protein [Planctomycetota bacterium]